MQPKGINNLPNKAPEITFLFSVSQFNINSNSESLYSVIQGLFSGIMKLLSFSLNCLHAEQMLSTVWNFQFGKATEEHWKSNHHHHHHQEPALSVQGVSIFPA